MASATPAINSFLGGEVSQFYQGRFDRPDYPTFMATCFNAMPREEGAWTRRGGTMFAGASRSAQAARTAKFDFEAIAPYTLEFTDGWLRFRSGLRWATTNDAVAVTAISTANPAVLQTAVAVTWATGNTVVFGNLGITAPLLQNRQFTLTKVNTTHFSLTDAITGANIDGSTLGALSAGATVSRIQEITTSYPTGLWANVRIIQAETNAVLLQGATAPQILRVTTLPTTGVDAQFSLAALTFLDGPYLDPFTTGVLVTPSGKSGNITLNLSFAAYSATQAYKVGDFVTSANVNYTSLVDDNVNNTPAISPTQWATTSPQVAINNGAGFLGSDVGRLVRLLSEPSPWAVGTAYVAGNIVSYNPTGVPGASTYWFVPTSGGSTGVIPGSNLENWAPSTNAAIWSWGRIVSITTSISGTLAGVAQIGDMTGGGGLAAGFDGNVAKPASTSARGGGTAAPTFTTYIGQNFTGCTPSSQKIASAIVYPGNDSGFVAQTGGIPIDHITFSIYGKNSAPASATDGTLIGQLTVTGNPTLPVSIVSTDQVNAYSYVWIAISPTVTGLGSTVVVAAAQVVLFNPPGSGVSNGVVIELLGPPLLYTNAISTWRLGVYSNTTGWPSCGTYHEGRLWFGGAAPNRFDASVSNGLVGSTLNFAPTDQNGVVSSANAISGVMNDRGVNPLLWMESDQQGIIAGTLARTWLISAPTPGPISPTNIAARPLVMEGSSTVEPRRTGHTLAYVQRYGRKVNECFADVYSGKLSAPNLAEKAMHITKAVVQELAYTSAVTPVIWGRNADGSWWGITYKRDVLSVQAEPKFAGWHRHALGSGRKVASICAGPSVGGALDALTMATVDPANGLYHVEVMTDAIDEGATNAQASYLDNAVNPTSVTSSSTTPAPYGGLTINGLWHLNGKTVTAWLGGLDCGDYAVSSGSITIPYGDGVSGGAGNGLFTASFAAGLSLSQMLVGFTFTSQGQPVRPMTPAQTGARTGPGLGKVRRPHKVGLLLEGVATGALSIGGDFTHLRAARMYAGDDNTVLPVTSQFSGVHRADLDATSDFDGYVCWRVTRPYIANVVAVQPFNDTSDG